MALGVLTSGGSNGHLKAAEKNKMVMQLDICKYMKLGLSFKTFVRIIATLNMNYYCTMIVQCPK